MEKLPCRIDAYLDSEFEFNGESEGEYEGGGDDIYVYIPPERPFAPRRIDKAPSPSKSDIRYILDHSAPHNGMSPDIEAISARGLKFLTTLIEPPFSTLRPLVRPPNQGLLTPNFKFVRIDGYLPVDTTIESFLSFCKTVKRLWGLPNTQTFAKIEANVGGTQDGGGLKVSVGDDEDWGYLLERALRGEMVDIWIILA